MVAEISGEQPAKSVHTTKVTIENKLTDEYGHVNYKNYPTIFEAGQDAYMASRGIGFDVIDKKTGLQNFVGGIKIDYKGQLFAGDKPLIKTSINRVGNSSFTFKQELQKNGQTIANCELVVVMVNKEGQPTPIPLDIKDKLL